MVQVIDEGGSFASRLGSNLGQALSDQVPKEIERMRLSRAMRSAMDPNLSPLERFARAAPFLKDYPQTAQTFGDLARFEGKRKSQISALRDGVQPQGMQQEPIGRERVQENIEDITIDETPSKTRRGEKDLRSSPFRSEMRNLLPLTPSQRENRIADILESNDYTSYEDARALLDDEEAQKAKLLSALREEDQFLVNKINEARNSLEDRTQKKLEASDIKEAWDEIPGELLTKTQTEIEDELAKNPNRSINKLIEEKADKLLEYAKTKNEFLQKARGRWTFETIGKGGKFRKDFERTAKIFKEFGMQDDFQKILEKEYQLTPDGASYFAYQPSKQVQKSLDSIPKFKGRLLDQSKPYSRDAAEKILKGLQPNDNLLALATELKLRNPGFDSEEFFDYFDENDENLTLRQKRQLANRSLDLINWQGMVLINNQKPKVIKNILED